ncbi:histone deacetylase family protein [Aquimarina agarilytica]|uniref:histone deacetylase family protein n=1 Tax=Aquimarina agarilytica TaxID=1087449 RepID=UPI00028A3385|nr:histone deacetylase [Aquimarina agarilytica]
MLKIAFHPCYEHPLKKGHRFPMEKYDLLPKQLLHEGTCTVDNFFEPKIVAETDVLRVHTEEYFFNLRALNLPKSEVRAIGFPLSETLVNRELIITQGSIDACKYAITNGIAMNIAGGTHHAFSNRGEAFCLLNDQAVAAAYLLHHKLAKKILIVDLDVHQGNGTAEIFKHNSKVFTFSMHGEKNYPFRKEISDLDIALPNGTDDQSYLSVLKRTLPKLFKQEQPDFVFYLSGVDILVSDKLGKLSCSLAGCMERDRYVLEFFYANSIPVMCSMGGGYSPDIKTIIEAHANTFRIANNLID